jgi:hypothetical protein
VQSSEQMLLHFRETFLLIRLGDDEPWQHMVVLPSTFLVIKEMWKGRVLLLG